MSSKSASESFGVGFALPPGSVTLKPADSEFVSQTLPKVSSRKGIMITHFDDERMLAMFPLEKGDDTLPRRVIVTVNYPDGTVVEKFGRVSKPFKIDDKYYAVFGSF